MTTDDAAHPFEPVAGRLHFIIFLGIVAAVTAAGFLAQQGTAAGTGHLDLLPIYVSAALLDWLLFFFCWRGVRRRGGTLRTIVGGRWPTVWHALRDLAIGAAFWGAFTGLTWWASRYLGWNDTSKIVEAILPKTPIEIGTWFGVSLTAGFCEEFVFRGYVQKQLRAYSGNIVLAVIGQALVFGVMHIYQGWSATLGVTAFGLTFGLLAAACKSLRPGMMAHAWEDIWSGWLSGVLFH